MRQIEVRNLNEMGLAIMEHLDALFGRMVLEEPERRDCTVGRVEKFHHNVLGLPHCPHLFFLSILPTMIDRRPIFTMRILTTKVFFFTEPPDCGWMELNHLPCRWMSKEHAWLALPLSYVRTCNIIRLKPKIVHLGLFGAFHKSSLGITASDDAFDAF